MAIIHAKWQGNGIFRMEAALEKLASPRRVSAVRRALNHTGDKVFTAVKRAVAKQVGVTQKVVVAKGGLRKSRASTTNLTYTIYSSGRHLSLKEFNARQIGAGTKASPWGKRRLFKSAFMGPRPGVVSGKLGGHVFVREGSRRMPIKKLFGPSIPNEIVKEESAAAFHAVAVELVPRVEHEVRVITDRVIS